MISGPGCCYASLTINDIYSCRKVILLITGWLLPSIRRREGGVVWFSSVCETLSVEDDAEH
jgi:hypothetical protein